jgi:toxin-antitoxin system PIN domain toxin
MKIIDLNILLYAVNKDAHHHQAIRLWWEEALAGEEPIGLCWLVLLGFLRLATNSKVFPKPLRIDEALEHVDAWLTHPNTKIVVETDEHWRVLRDFLHVTGSAGNLTSNAHLAALALEYGAVLSSCDADFSRFPNLRWQNPI